MLSAAMTAMTPFFIVAMLFNRWNESLLGLFHFHCSALLYLVSVPGRHFPLQMSTFTMWTECHSAALMPFYMMETH